MTRLAKPSMTESIPKPTRAIEPASTPAVMATAPFGREQIAAVGGHSFTLTSVEMS